MINITIIIDRESLTIFPVYALYNTYTITPNRINIIKPTNLFQFCKVFLKNFILMAIVEERNDKKDASNINITTPFGNRQTT